MKSKFQAKSKAVVAIRRKLSDAKTDKLRKPFSIVLSIVLGGKKHLRLFPLVNRDRETSSHYSSAPVKTNLGVYFTPDTTGITQLLDQVNKNLHPKYCSTKDYLFAPMQAINQSAFMTILANIWDKWASKSVLVSCKAGWYYIISLEC